jgi:phenylacetate-CoA ligase
LWGAPREIKRQDRIRILRDWLLSSKLLSAFDMGEDVLAGYAKVIAQYRPGKMYGYASAFYLLARYLEKIHWHTVADLKVIFTTAEPLFQFQRKTIQNVFGCPVSVEYGSRDAGLVANECPDGGLHIFAEGMYVEIMGSEGNKSGEIVVSNFDSLAFPIIRYRTGDIGSLEPSTCPCGRTLPRLAEVEGRQTDFIVTPEGRILHALSVIYILRAVISIKQFKVIQEALDRFVIQLVPDGSFTSNDRTSITEQLRLLLGKDTKIELQELPSIPPAASGKFRYVESKVAANYLETAIFSEQSNSSERPVVG